mmetsp:Transcript_37524/g.41455  ORF Transcript_37524/g.41455 Transcript_37524/m.41455 type:complete len:491 (+) Transcript_37524:445-1917(+)
MSKWLRRDSENNDTRALADNFQPPPSEMATAAGSTFHQSTNQQPMVGYSSASPGNIAMDVDDRRNREKYQSNNIMITNGQEETSRNRSRSGREGDTPQERSRSGRVSRSNGRSRSSRNPTATQNYHYQSRQVATNGPVMTPQHYGSSQFNTSGHPSDNAQPTYPPPAVTNDEQTPSQPSSQRRPAYLLHRDLVIGKGSYGQVCIASRGEPEGHTGGRSGKRKKFACKCVMLRNDPKYIAKLQEEVNVLRELRGHSNVIRLYDVFCVDNELFIITELGRGGDLFHLLTTHPKHGVTESYAAKTVAEMLSAVAFLHSRHICHRDLKLENWVLESGKDVWSPLKLIDFGLSTHFSPGQRLSRVVGSSYYVAPEVLKKAYTEACDLWSLGVIVYMLLSGAPPFYGKNDEAIKASIVQGEYTFPHELFRDVSDQAMQFVSTLLSYNTEYRYTAQQALTHDWLAANLDPDALQRAKDGAMGVGIMISDNASEPMQL